MSKSALHLVGHFAMDSATIKDCRAGRMVTEDTVHRDADAKCQIL